MAIELLANLRGKQGVPGPQGLPGLEDVPTDPGVAALVSLPSETRTAILNSLGLIVPIFGAGIDPTGVADSTAAIQAIIDAHPKRRLRLGAGVFKISTINLTKGQHLEGVGQQDYRDRFTTFGSAGWMVNANFGGTVIRSTHVGTSAAITILDSEVNAGGLSNFTLIGPGTGTSVGVLIGNTTITVVNLLISKVKIGNFYVGMRTNLMNEGSLYDLAIHGCTTGLDMAYATNQNAFYMLDMQRCGNALVIGSDSYSNTFYSFIGQSNTGIALTLGGTKNVFYNPYFENNAVRAVLINPSAKGNSIHDPFCNGTSDSIRVEALAADNVISGVGGYGTVIAIQDLGTRTYLQGRLSGLVNGGVTPMIVDSGFAGSAFGPWATYPVTLGGTGAAIGNGTMVGRYRLVGKTVEFEIVVTAGSTTTFGTAQVTVGLPFPLQSVATLSGEYHATGAYFSLWGLKIVGSSSLRMYGYGSGGAAMPVTNSAPAAMAAGNVFIARGVYETA